MYTIEFVNHEGTVVAMSFESAMSTVKALGRPAFIYDSEGNLVAEWMASEGFIHHIDRNNGGDDNTPMAA